MPVDWAAHMRRAQTVAGTTATWTPAGGDPVEITGVYMAPYRTVELGLAGVDASAPEFDAMTADVPGIAQGDALEVDGTQYEIAAAPRPDPVSGITKLVLETA